MTTTRDGPLRSSYGFNVGTRCGDEPEAVAKNRTFVREVLRLPSEPRWLQQVHGTRVVLLDSGQSRDPTSPPPADGDERAEGSSSSLPPPAGEGARRAGGGNAPRVLEPKADAVVTRTPGVVLAIQTADCLPVLLGAEDGAEIAAAHAGWRGLSAGVLENTLGAMRTPPSNIIAWLGPAIAAASYEVGGEVRDAFLSRDPASASAFSATRPDHWACDLYELARQRLRSAGVSCIAGGGFDTFTDPRLHSYRRDGAHSGRMASLIWIGP